MKVLSFSGGVHPEYCKELTSSRPVEPVELPKTVVIPLSQHLGAPCNPAVKKGDEVKTGQVVGEPAGFVSAPVHASVSGKVVEVDLRAHPFGAELPAVVIESDGRDEWQKMQPIDHPLGADPKVLRERIRDAGLVGMGGAAFPTHVKLSPPKDKPIDAVLLNGAECEPFLTADDLLMRDRPVQVLKGFELVKKILGARIACVCVEENKPEAIEILGREIVAFKGLELVTLKVKYPQGGEKQLIDAVLGRQVPAGGLPMDCGVVVHNVGTCAGIHDAVYEGLAFVERITTVTGGALARPSNLRVRVGTLVSHLIEHCGGYSTEPGKVVMGGPMMGMAVHHTDVPVVKGTSGVLVQRPEEVLVGGYTACIRCGMCVRACPIRLTPNEMGNHSEMGQWERVEALDLMDCIECGCCAYVCPSFRPLVQFFRQAKAKARERAAKEKAKEAGAKN